MSVTPDTMTPYKKSLLEIRKVPKIIEGIKYLIPKKQVHRKNTKAMIHNQVEHFMMHLRVM